MQFLNNLQHVILLWSVMSYVRVMTFTQFKIRVTLKCCNLVINQEVMSYPSVTTFT